MDARRVLQCGVMSSAIWLSSTLALLAADLKPSWHCLPEETVVIARAPQPKEFFEAFRTRTKLGTILLKQDRLEKLVALFKEQAKDDLAEFEKVLGELNLKVDDWQQLFSGELGLAVSVHPRGDKQSPLGMVLAWVEPGEELGTRLIAAIEKGVADQKETKFPTKRVDLDLAGHTVLYLSIPQTQIDDDDAFEPLPDDFGKFTPEQRREWQEKQRKKLENAKRTQTGQQNVFVTRLGGRMLVGMTIVGNTRFNAFDANGDQAIDQNFDLASGADEAKGIFARFLESHTSDAPATTLALLETPGLRQALPEGLPVVELLADPRPLMRANFEDFEELLPKLKAYGVDGFGPVAYRQTLDGNVTRSGFFASLPAPRRGLLTLLDQEPGPADVPNWVTREPLEYQHIHFDLGKAYTTIKQIVLQEEGDKAKPGFDLAEGQVQAQLQTDVATLLSSLGTRHVALSFEPKVDAAKPANKKPDPHFGDGTSQRLALVWQLKDEALWQKILQLAAPFAGGNVQDEQGFKGLRAPQAPGAGLFIGRGFLVIGMGEGVLESTLTALRNPPAPDNALHASDVLRRGHELLPPEPGMVYGIVDAARYSKFFGQMRSIFVNMQFQETRQGEIDVIKALQALLPTDAEMDGVLGVNVGALRMTEHGIVGNSVSELPAP